jgi:hypothetical protein
MTHRPRVLELTAADELVALENLGVLQQNGFEVGQDDDQPAGRRLKLLAQPVSKKTEFDVQGKMRLRLSKVFTRLTWVSRSATVDLEEILHLLRDRPSGTLVRSSKTRAMFAMRACRKSTMVGAPLNAKQMTAVGFPPLHMSQPFFFCFLLTYQPDHSTHGNDGTAVELPSRSTNDETLVGHWSDGEEEEGEGCGLGSIFTMVVLRPSGDCAVGEARRRESHTDLCII